MENSVNHCNYICFFKDDYENRVMRSKCYNIELILYDNANEVVNLNKAGLFEGSFFWEGSI